MKHRTKEKGFTALEVVIIAVVILALALGGWWVWQKNNEDPGTTNHVSSGTEKNTHTKLLNCKDLFEVTYPDSLQATITDAEQCLISSVDVDEMPPVAPLPPEQLGLFFGAQATKITSSKEYLDNYIERSQEDSVLTLKSQEDIKLDSGDMATLAVVFGGHPTQHDFYFFIYIKDGMAITTSYPVNSNYKEATLTILKSIK